MGTLLTVCENGYGKRTEFGEYRYQSRGGYGVIDIKTTERNGDVIGAFTVYDDDEIMMVTAHGKIVRTAVSQIRAISRNTQGVTLINCADGDRLVAVGRVVENGSEDDQAEDTEEPVEGEGNAVEADDGAADPGDDGAADDEADTDDA